MNLLIEKMTLKDLEEISDIFYSEFDDYWTITMLKQELENLDTYYLVAKINNEIVGIGGVHKILDEMNVNYIVTKKNKRNLGIASQILYNLISFANTKKIKTIMLEVNEKNIFAIKLYEKFQFKKVGLRKKYYNNTDNAIMMTKNMNL